MICIRINSLSWLIAGQALVLYKTKQAGQLAQDLAFHAFQANFEVLKGIFPPIET